MNTTNLAQTTNFICGSEKLKLFEAIIIRWRLAPFKTKYTPNFKMDWGKKYENATYPQREKAPVELFDLKTFVKKQKEAKMC